MGIFREFRTFIMRGNVIDLAVGIIIGGAFGKIVSSMVNDLLMPVLGLLLGGVNFSDEKILLRPAVLNPNGTVATPANTLNWGMFVQNTIDFIIIAFAIFMLIKFINSLKREEKPLFAEPTSQEKLLMEIRDLLKR